MILNWQAMPDGDEKRKAYYCSREWSLKKASVRQRSKGTCERCKHGKAVHCHHLTYARLYAELLTDLMDVCEGCHNWLHPAHGKAPKEDPKDYWKEPVPEKPFTLVSGGCVQCPRCRGESDNVRLIARDATIANTTRGDAVLVPFVCGCGYCFSWSMECPKGETQFEVVQTEADEKRHAVMFG